MERSEEPRPLHDGCVRQRETFSKQRLGGELWKLLYYNRVYLRVILAPG